MDEKDHGDGGIDADNIEAMLTASHAALSLITESQTRAEMDKNSIDGVGLAKRFLDQIEKDILSNVKEIQDAGCECPVCAIAKRKIKEEAESVAVLKKSIGKIEPGEGGDPLGAVQIINTVMIILIHIPKLILTMSEMAEGAHQMCRMVLAGKIVGLHTQQEDEEPDEECTNCGACGKLKN